MRYIINKSLCAMLLLSALGTSISTAADNAVYNELTNQGITLSNGKTVKLPSPLMADGLKADAQKAVMLQVAPKIMNLQTRFLRGNSNDDFVSKYMDEKGAPDQSIGRRVDVYFVANGKFKTIASSDFVKQQIAQGKNNAKEESGKNGEGDADSSEKGSGDEKPKDKKEEKNKRAENGKIEFYTNEELKAHKLKPIDKDDLKERYAHGMVDLLDQVQVSGTGHAIQTLTDESILVAFKMDPRFDKDAKYPNQYKLITNNAAGVPVPGNPKTYDGFGGYAKITKLDGPEDKVFVEYHIVFDEPKEWFNGTTALVSKLDYSYQTDIRKFRRNVLAFKQKVAAGNNPAPNPPAATPAKK